VNERERAFVQNPTIGRFERIAFARKCRFQISEKFAEVALALA
jgi:hypothetical protein